jgi:hypothetical protein
MNTKPLHRLAVAFLLAVLVVVAVAALFPLLEGLLMRWIMPVG